MNRILVTGGAGFLGSSLCAALAQNPDNHVTALDNLSTGSLENLESLKSFSNFQFVQQDIRNGLSLPADQIYNAACPASPHSYQCSPVYTTQTCVLGMINMLELARKTKAKVLQFSTSEVYGDPLMHPQKEEYWGNVNPIGVRSCYDEGKRCAESLCFDYAREYGVRVKIVRIFNTYGPRLNSGDGRVISNFISQALHGRPITVYGDGSQTRSFCYVDDMVTGLIRMMNDTEDSFQGPVNLGNPEEIDVLTLARKIKEKTNSNSELMFMPLPGDDPVQRRPDITLAREKLNWSPAVPLEEGLERTIRFHRSLLTQ